MKTITLTKDEIETLHDFLWCNPCRSGCIYGYKRIDCYGVRKDGEYKCRLQRDKENILRKIGE